MSSINSSDGSNNNREDQVVRRNREDYNKKASDMVKKHQREMRRISEQHYAEVENLKTAHQKQMEQLHKLSNDSISERDHRHQSDIDELRGMYKKQMEQHADETQRREENLRKSNTGQIDQQKSNTDARMEKLNQDYSEALKTKDKLYQEALAENRDAQARSLAANREKQASYHQREMASVKGERNETVGHLQKEYRDYRENAEGRLKGQEVKHMQDQHRSSNSLVRAVQKERSLRTESEEILRDGFEDGLDKTRERYDKAMKKEREAQRFSGEHLKSTTVDRVENQVRRLENEKEDLKEAKVRNELQLKNKQNREINNIRDAFTKNVENLQEQRDEAVRMSNDRNREDVQSVRKEMGDQLVHSNRFFRERMAEQNRINREAYTNIKGDFDARGEQTKTNADLRVMRIYEDTNAEKARMIELQQQNHITGQQLQADEVKKARLAVEDEKNIAVRNMQDHMRKQELRHSEKLATTVAKYEKQIQTLKDQMLRERKLGEDNMKRTVEEMQRAHQVAIDQLDSKNKDQMRTVQMQHADQVKGLSRRHEEKMDALITEVKKT